MGCSFSFKEKLIAVFDKHKIERSKQKTNIEHEQAGSPHFFSLFSGIKQQIAKKKIIY